MAFSVVATLVVVSPMFGGSTRSSARTDRISTVADEVPFPLITAPFDGDYAVSQSQTASLAINDGSGIFQNINPGKSLTVALPSLSIADVQVSHDLSLPAIGADATPLYESTQLRRQANGDYYAATVVIRPDGSLALKAERVSGGVQKTISRVPLSATISAGQSLHVESRIAGSQPVTLLARAWTSGQATPDWQLVATDNDAGAIGQPGAVGLRGYLSRSGRLASFTVSQWTVSTMTAPTSTASPTSTSDSTTAPATGTSGGASTSPWAPSASESPSDSGSASTSPSVTATSETTPTSATTTSQAPSASESSSTAAATSAESSAPSPTTDSMSSSASSPSSMSPSSSSSSAETSSSEASSPSASPASSSPASSSPASSSSQTTSPSTTASPTASPSPTSSPSASSSPVTVSAAGFVHPGIVDSSAQLALVASNIQAGRQPSLSAFLKAKNSRYGQLSWQPHAVAWVGCGAHSSPDEGCTNETDDAQAAYTDALVWAYTGDPAYASKSLEILNAWSATLQGHKFDTSVYVNGRIQAAWAAETFTKAAEIMRYSNAGWSSSDIQRFENMLNIAFLPLVVNGWTGGGANWQLSMAEATMNIGVFTDSRVVFQLGVDAWRKQVKAAIYLSSDGTQPILPAGTTVKAANINAYWYGPTRLVDGLEGEDCRDLTHATMGFAAALNGAETASIQGIDLYGEQKTRLITGMEYTTRFLNDPGASGWVCPKPPTIAGAGATASWEIGYNHYATQGGEALPQTKKWILANRPTATAQHMNWETLTHGSAMDS